MKIAIRLAAGLVLANATVAGALAQSEPPFSDAVGTDYPKNVYFGDLHLHTRDSPDAYSEGNTNLSSDVAFRFARGEEIEAHNGMMVRIYRPLDFLAVTDHGEFLGMSYRLGTRNEQVMNAEWTEANAPWVDEDIGPRIRRMFVRSILDRNVQRDTIDDDVRRTIWSEVAEAADRHNVPGQFTAFTAYEFTSMIDGNNLHRCVIYADGADKTTQMLPFTSLDSLDPEHLWSALADYEAKTGGSVLAIPHNGNISGGMMFDERTLGDEPISRAYAEARMRWEPVVEVTQVKGDSETHPILSPTDEFADYERWDRYNIMGSQELTVEQLPGSYVRSAYKRGLEIEAKIGANPYAFGIIGSTDGHNTFTTFKEENFFGKFPSSEPTAERVERNMAGGRWANWRLTSSGLAAVWAEENTRESLFAAIKRKEVYATTGSRIRLRFFGGWSFEDGDVDTADYVKRGYTRGVPMGSDLTGGPEGKAPTFIVAAAKDPDDANLDRIQIVKGWLDAGGTAQEQVYDVALSDGREADPATGEVPPVGSTVDEAAATYFNSIGDAQLSAQWTDPDFDPSQSAFYYARVIEIPKPRWTAYDRKFFGTAVPEAVPMSLQDRAYSSPIWYRP